MDVACSDIDHKQMLIVHGAKTLQGETVVVRLMETNCNLFMLLYDERHDDICSQHHEMTRGAKP